MAAGASNCEMTLYQNADNRADNRLYSNDMASTSVPVQVVTVDSILEEMGVAGASCKIDVQGFEALVFAGMRRLLENSDNVILISEFWSEGLRACDSDPVKMLEDLERLGFKLFLLGPRGRLRILEDKLIVEKYHGRRYTNVVGIKRKS